MEIVPPSTIHTTFNIPIVTAQEALDIDKTSIETYGLDARLLMGWAGYGIFLRLHIKKMFHKAPAIHFLLGKGNNAGDGYVLAWHILNSSSKKIYFWQWDAPHTKDAIYFSDLCQNNYHNQITIAPLDKITSFPFLKNMLIIDCLFGSGMRGQLPKPMSKIFNLLNQLTHIKRIAIDIASGLSADANAITREPLKADITYALGAYKITQLLPPGIFYSGKIKLITIGFAYTGQYEHRRLAKHIPYQALRKNNSNKYTSGVLHILGGSASMEGSTYMAGNIFLQMGGGMAKIYSTSTSIKKYLSKTPEILYITQDNIRILCNLFLENIQNVQSKPYKTVILIGIGLAEQLDHAFLQTILALDKLLIIFDGSILSHISQHSDLFQNNYGATVIMTPHTGEASRLVCQKTITNHRTLALKIANLYNCYVYLKGPGGILVSPPRDTMNNQEIYFHSQHFQLATAGTGDLLVGIIANMLYRYNKPIQAIEKGIVTYLSLAKQIAQTNGSKDFLTPSQMMSLMK